MSPRVLLPFLAAAVVGACALAPVAPAAPLGFAPPIFVDQNLAGGEPLVTADPVHGTLVYTSHEGTTHLYQPGLATSSVFPFLANYRDQVNMWTSKDGGNTCSQTGIADHGTFSGETTYEGDGKLYYVADRDMLVEPTCLSSPDGSCDRGLSVSTWKRGDTAFKPQGVAYNQRLVSH